MIPIVEAAFFIMKTHLRQGAAKLPAADFRAGQGASRNMMRIDGQFVISRETVSLYFFAGASRLLTTNPNRYIIPTKSGYPHPVLPRFWRREIIGNQVQVLSDPVTVSEESAANAIAKARRRGG